MFLSEILKILVKFFNVFPKVNLIKNLDFLKITKN